MSDFNKELTYTNKVTGEETTFHMRESVGFAVTAGIARSVVQRMIAEKLSNS